MHPKGERPSSRFCLIHVDITSSYPGKKQIPVPVLRGNAKYIFAPSRPHPRIKSRLPTTPREPATANSPGRIEQPELVPVKTAGEVLFVADPPVDATDVAVAPTSNEVLQGEHEVMVVVISTKV